MQQTSIAKISASRPSEETKEMLGIVAKDEHESTALVRAQLHDHMARLEGATHESTVLLNSTASKKEANLTSEENSGIEEEEENSEEATKKYAQQKMKESGKRAGEAAVEAAEITGAIAKSAAALKGENISAKDFRKDFREGEQISEKISASKVEVASKTGNVKMAAAKSDTVSKMNEKRAGESGKMSVANKVDTSKKSGKIRVAGSVNQADNHKAGALKSLSTQSEKTSEQNEALHKAHALKHLVGKEDEKAEARTATFNGRIGVAYRPDSGMVTEVMAGGSAEKAGVRQGMQIQSIDGHPYSNELFKEKRAALTNYDLQFSKALKTSEHEDSKRRATKSKDSEKAVAKVDKTEDYEAARDDADEDADEGQPEPGDETVEADEKTESDKSPVDTETAKYYWLGKNGNLARVGSSSYSVTRDFTGGPTWNVTLKPTVRSTPLIDDLRNLYVSTMDGHVYKYDHEGEPQWNSSIGANVYATPIITQGSLILSTDSAEIVAISMKTGNVTWRKLLSESCKDAKGFTISAGSGVVVVAARSGANCGNLSYIQAVDLKKGESMWTFLPSHKMNDRGFLAGMFAIRGSEMIFASINGNAYKLDIQTGAQLWAHEPAPINVNSTVIPANCTLDYQPVAPPAKLESSGEEAGSSSKDADEESTDEGEIDEDSTATEGSETESDQELISESDELETTEDPDADEELDAEQKESDSEEQQEDAERESVESNFEKLAKEHQKVEAMESDLDGVDPESDPEASPVEDDAEKVQTTGEDDEEQGRKKGGLALDVEADEEEQKPDNELDEKAVNDLQEHTGVIWSEDQQVILVTSNPVDEKTGKRIGRLEALNIETGEALWQVNLDTMISNGPVIGQLHPSGKGDPSILVAVSTSGATTSGSRMYTAKLIAFKADDGALSNWQYQQLPWADNGSCFEGRKQAFSNPAIGGDGTVYVGSGNGFLYGIQDRDGDGFVDATAGSSDVFSYESEGAFLASPSIAPGILAAAPCNGLLVFKSF
jgi:outer membrane protein assembly factor BamB